MDYDRLLRDARAAGLDLRVEGEKLIMEGPPSAAPIVKRLTEAKAGIVVALQSERGEVVGPPWPCGVCKTQNWRAVRGTHIVCGTCHDKGAALMARVPEGVSP